MEAHPTLPVQLIALSEAGFSDDPVPVPWCQECWCCGEVMVTCLTAEDKVYEGEAVGCQGCGWLSHWIVDGPEEVFIAGDRHPDPEVFVAEWFDESLAAEWMA